MRRPLAGERGQFFVCPPSGGLLGDVERGSALSGRPYGVVVVTLTCRERDSRGKPELQFSAANVGKVETIAVDSCCMRGARPISHVSALDPHLSHTTWRRVATIVRCLLQLDV